MVVRFTSEALYELARLDHRAIWLTPGSRDQVFAEDETFPEVATSAPFRRGSFRSRRIRLICKKARPHAPGRVCKVHTKVLCGAQDPVVCVRLGQPIGIDEIP